MKTHYPTFFLDDGVGNYHCMTVAPSNEGKSLVNSLITDGQVPSMYASTSPEPDAIPKPTIPDVLPVVKAWYAKPGNAAGGMFHVILDDGNYEQQWAASALKDAHTSGDADAIRLAEMLAAMSPTQRRKLLKMDKR